MGNLPFEREHEIIIRQPSTTDPAHGCAPSNRPISELLDLGIVNINKPSGPSSHQVSAYVQEALGIDKAGHSGTLDPKVTGVLPVALGRGTRVVQALLPAGKEYVCLMHLHHPVEENTLRKTLTQQVGKIKQLPPIKSAVKRQWRERMIYYIEILDIIEKDVLFRIGCEAGTYIRKFCTDVGDQLGVGAHMSQLVRTKAGPFTDNNMVILQDLRDAYHYHQESNDKLLRHIVRPIEEAIAHLSRVWVHDSAVKPLCHGRNLAVPGISKVEAPIKEDALIGVMSLKGELIALGRAVIDHEQMLRNSAGIAVRIEKVFMRPDRYPKL